MTKALQVFAGTIPLSLVLAGVFFRGQTLLKNILARLGSIQEWMIKVERRLTTLETRAGIVCHKET